MKISLENIPAASVDVGLAARLAARLFFAPLGPDREWELPETIQLENHPSEQEWVGSQPPISGTGDFRAPGAWW